MWMQWVVLACFVNSRLEVSERDINREHRQMALFQEPPPDIHKIDAREEAPEIDNRILYYLAVVLTDPQVIEMVDLMRVSFALFC